MRRLEGPIRFVADPATAARDAARRVISIGSSGAKRSSWVLIPDVTAISSHSVVSHRQRVDEIRPVGYVRRMEPQPLLKQLIDLESRGWDALCDGTGADFYGRVMTDDGLMVLANGNVMKPRRRGPLL